MKHIFHLRDLCERAEYFKYFFYYAESIFCWSLDTKQRRDIIESTGVKNKQTCEHMFCAEMEGGVGLYIWRWIFIQYDILLKIRSWKSV